MASHCASLLPQAILLPRQMYAVMSVEYGFGVVAPSDVAFFRDTPPPRGRSQMFASAPKRCLPAERTHASCTSRHRTDTW